jgi:hypothetical protein
MIILLGLNLNVICVLHFVLCLICFAKEILSFFYVFSMFNLFWFCFIFYFGLFFDQPSRVNPDKSTQLD